MTLVPKSKLDFDPVGHYTMNDAIELRKSIK